VLKALLALVEALVPFGLMMFAAVEMKPDYYPVQLEQLEVTTVSIVRMLESYALQVSVAVFNLLAYIYVY
jgi:hypothetical protein